MTKILAETTTLATQSFPRGSRAELLHCPAGEYLAGSGTRMQANETYLARLVVDGTSYGQHYATRADAEAHYARIVAHETGIVVALGKASPVQEEQ